MAQYDIVLKMWTASALLAHLWVLCFLLSTCSAAPEPLWSLDQVGSYFNGIFRSIVEPLLGVTEAPSNATIIVD